MKNNRRSKLSSTMLVQYFLSLVGFAVLLVLGVELCVVLYVTFNLGDYYLINRLAQFGKDFFEYFFAGAAFIGWVIITYYFINKPLRCLDEIVAAAEQLAAEPQRPVKLPAAMHDTQNELNLVRERALKAAADAREAEQRKNDLIVYLAHDLKTPLTSVIGYLTLLRDEPQLSPQMRAKYTGIALEKAERLEELINEFFEITRFNLSHIELECAAVNLTRMLAQATSEFEPMLAEKGMRWEISAPWQGDIYIICDADKLARVFDNLFRNAVSYAYPGTAIALSLQREGETAVVRVENHGKTIPPEKLTRIFEQFFRLDSSRASSTGGAGLGLAIAKEIVEQHGGTITAESENESIVFTVRLPAVIKTQENAQENSIKA